jgi:hypothetical protein
MTKLLPVFFVLLLLQSCYISKSVKSPCTLRIEDDFSVSITKPDNPKYIRENEREQYKEKFLEGLKSELSTYGVTVVSSSLEKADYVLKITSFRLSESTNTTTVDDAASQYNGQSYTLHSCDADVDFALYQDGKKKGNWWAGLKKEEKLTNKRNVGDYVLGTNKENSEYRHKGLADDVFMDISQKAGRRTAARLTKKIGK